MLPESEFRLYAVCARFPQSLASQVALEELQTGVYQVRWGTDDIRILVTKELPETENNAILHLFSAAPERVRYGVQHFRRRSDDLSTIVDQLFAAYYAEGITMPYTMEDFRRDYLKEHLKELTPEERLAGLLPEELLKGLPPEERLKGLLPEELLKGLPPEERLKGLPPEERLKGLPPEEILKRLSVEQLEQYLKELKRRNGGAKPSDESL